MPHQTIWYISKYAITPAYGNTTRQFYFSKYFALKGYNVILLSSFASGIKYNESFKGNKYYKYTFLEGVHHYILKGPKISLGFSFKRIISWLQFEWYVFRLSKKLSKKFPPDCVIVSSLSLLTILNGIFLKFKYKAKLIFEVRDIWPLTLVKIGGYSRFNPIIIILGLIERIGYAFSDVVVGTMPNLKQHVLGIVKEKNVQYIPHGIDLNYYAKDNLTQGSISILNSVIKTNFNIVYAGSFGKSNGIDSIIETFIKVNNYLPKSNLHLIGEGPLKKDIVFKFGNHDSIFIHPAVPKRDIPLLIKNFDLTIAYAINTELYNYGISFNKINEYLLSGTPSVLIYSGYTSLIESADSGYVISHDRISILADKLIEIINTENGVLGAKGNNGLQYAVKYLDYNYLSSRYLDIIFPTS